MSEHHPHLTVTAAADFSALPRAADMEPQVVRTAAGWHGRIRAGNHEPIWATQVLKERASVVNAYRLLGVLTGGDPSLLRETLLQDVDEREPNHDGDGTQEVPC